MVSSPGDAAVGSLVWRPCFRSRKDVSYLGVRSWRSDAKRADIDALKDVKRDCRADVIDAAATDLTLVASSFGGPLSGWTVTTVPCGHSRRPDCFAKQLAQRCAVQLGLPFLQVWADRYVSGSSHPKEFAKLPPLEWVAAPPGPMLLIDDVATSGWHMEEALLALRSRGVTALGLVWIGGEVVPPRAETASPSVQKPTRVFKWWIPGS